MVSLAGASGQMSLALRGLADSSASALAASALGSGGSASNGPVAVFRYGLPRAGGEARGE
jgi:Flp pilus assembly protein CpaB